MSTKKENLQKLVSKETTNTVARNRAHIKNRARLREYQQIALKVLTKLDELGWSQQKLAQEMKVSFQEVTKIVSGKEQLTKKTQMKLQEILNIPTLATPHGSQSKVKQNVVQIIETSHYKLPNQTSTNEHTLFSKKTFKIDYNNDTEEYSSYQQVI